MTDTFQSNYLCKGYVTPLRIFIVILTLCWLHILDFLSNFPSFFLVGYAKICNFVFIANFSRGVFALKIFRVEV